MDSDLITCVPVTFSFDYLFIYKESNEKDVLANDRECLFSSN